MFFPVFHTFFKKVKPLIPCCFRNINFDPFGSVWKHWFGKHLAWTETSIDPNQPKNSTDRCFDQKNPGVCRPKKIQQPLGKKRLFEFRLPMAGHLQHEVYRPPGGGWIFSVLHVGCWNQKGPEVYGLYYLCIRSCNVSYVISFIWFPYIGASVAF